MRSASSPGASDGDMGVYGRMMGLPLSFTIAAGLDALTSRNDATGMRDASFSGNSKIKLEQALSERKTTRKRVLKIR